MTMLRKQSIAEAESGDWIERLGVPVVGSVYFLLGDFETALDVAGTVLVRIAERHAVTGGRIGVADEVKALRIAAELAETWKRTEKADAKEKNPVLGALGTLPWRLRQILIWREMNELSEKEVAELLDARTTEIRDQLYLAREDFARAYASGQPEGQAGTAIEHAIAVLRKACVPPLPPMFKKWVEQEIEEYRRRAAVDQAPDKDENWRVDVVHVAPSDSRGAGRYTSKLLGLLGSRRLRLDRDTGPKLAAGLSVVVLLATGLWALQLWLRTSLSEERPSRYPAVITSPKPSSRTFVNTSKPEEVSPDTIREAMKAKGLVEYHGEWLTPKSRDERELARLMTERGYIFHDGVWTERNQYLESQSLLGRETEPKAVTSTPAVVAAKPEPPEAAAPETNKIEVAPSVVQPVVTNVPPASNNVIKVEAVPEAPRKEEEPAKGAGLAAAEQTAINAAVRRLKEDLLADYMFSPVERRQLNMRLSLIEQRERGTKDEDSRERLRKALEDVEKKGVLPQSAMKQTHPQFGLGERVLVCLSLVRAGVSPRHPLVQRIWNDLYKTNRDLDGSGVSGFTYRAGVGLMFVEAMMHSPSGEKWPETSDKELKVQMWVKRVADDLVESGTTGRWSYNRGSSSASDNYDHSNTQYATLGLKAARLCGWKPDGLAAAGVWLAVLDHFMDAQAKHGEAVEVKVQTEKTGRGGVDYAASGWKESPGEDRGYQATAEARGWDYKGIGSGGGTLNMTIAGLTAVILSRSESVRLKKEKEAAVDRAVRDAMAWVQVNWPGPGLEDGYGLYGIERLGVLGNLAKIGGHEWYRELAPGLAAKVLSGRLRGGSHGVDVERAFILLFLVRGTSSTYATPVPDQ